MSPADVVAGRADWAVACGDALAQLALLPDGCVQTCVTSPPYFGLRRYLDAGHPDAALEVGGEPTLDAYVDRLVWVFREVRRVLHPTGTVFLNLGDGYQDKQLLGVPWLVAFALRADGYYLRSEITWVKTACMPESVTDRPTSATEKIFLLSKRATYYYDQEAVAEPADQPDRVRADKMGGNKGDATHHSPGAVFTGAATRNQRNAWVLGPEPLADAHYAAWPTEIPRRAILAGTPERGVCPDCGNPWKRVVATSYVPHGPSAKAQRKTAFGERSSGDLEKGAFRPQEMPYGRATRVDETTGWAPTCTHGRDPVPALVLDPFCGSGRTLTVALRHGRRAIGVELSPTYAAMAERLVAGDCPLFNTPNLLGEAAGCD